MYLETQNKWKNKGPLNSDRKKKKRTLSLSVLTSPRMLVPLPDARCQGSLWVGAELPVPIAPQPVPTWALPTSPHPARGKQNGAPEFTASPQARPKVAVLG